MSDRLISADKLKAHYSWWKGGNREMTMDEAKSDFDCIIDLQPTVDPVKHGRWIQCGDVYSDGDYECSECHKREWSDTDYCPNCGALMDLDEVENV